MTSSTRVTSGGRGPAVPVRTPAWVDRHVGLVLTGLVAFVVATVVVSFHVWPAQAAAVGATAPYTDAQATGYVTLYDKAGNAIKSGRVKDKPFVWKAVGTKPATAPYDATGRKATLVAYQPRKGIAPGAWSSDTLTASTAYPDVKHPTATATAEDFSLQDFLTEFPPQWDGMVQVRLYLSAPKAQAQTTGYASTDLKITGDTWVVVGGGPGAGPGGANIPGKVASTPKASASPGGSGAPGPSSGASASSSAGAVAGGDTSVAGTGTEALADLPYLRTPGYLSVAASVIVAVVFGGALFRRRRQFASGEW